MCKGKKNHKSLLKGIKNIYHNAVDALEDLDQKSGEEKTDSFYRAIKLNIEANQVSYKNAHLNDLTINFDLNEKRADLNKFTFKFAKGTGDISAYALNTGQEFHPCYISSKFDNFDIHEILASFDNFDQDAFTPENTTGLISLKSSHHLSLNSDFTTNINDNTAYIFLYHFVLTSNTLHNFVLQIIK